MRTNSLEFNKSPRLGPSREGGRGRSTVSQRAAPGLRRTSVARPARKHPTEGELEILRVVWDIAGTVDVPWTGVVRGALFGGPKSRGRDEAGHGRSELNHESAGHS